jgi:hypothetical protein
MFEFATAIFGGLPVVVRARLYPAEPGVGLSSSYFEVEQILTRKMRPIPLSWWERLERSGGLESLADEAWVHV